tara:strand:- start:54 stop:509 length:456 start_codon:yes stop_codon:yes gene_type:complete
MTTLELPKDVQPTVEERKDCDLKMNNIPESTKDRLHRMFAEGNEREKILYNILTESLIEVKSDFKWQDTGNVAIEFVNYGKASGIAATKAEYWIIELHKTLPDGTTTVHTRLLESVTDLKEKVKNTHIVYGGDNKASGMYLVPLTKFIKVD